MLLSKLIGKRYKERPSDAYLDSHVFLLRGGYARQVGNGIFSLLTPAKRIVAKIEAILRQEMDNVDGQEVLFPVVVPGELWQESGRFQAVGSELVRFKDRTGRDMCLGMTHEEAAVHLARSEVVSYSEYPFMIYQIQTKFRDEPRSRGGLVRVREFIMKDGYSFHTSQEDLEKYYDRVHQAYERIFKRAGLKNVISVKSDTGMMGGKVAHEFMYLTDKGEDSLVVCPSCGYSSNLEVAQSQIIHEPSAPAAIEEVHTPGIKDIESLSDFFGVEQRKLIKATVFSQEGTDRLLVVFIRGDYSVNEIKLKNLVGHEVYAYNGNDSSLCYGFIGPYQLNADADIFFDTTLEGEENMICGANKEDYHLKGISVSQHLQPEFVNLYKVNDGDKCSHCGSGLTVTRGVEVGNIFQLGTKYTTSMNMTYIDSNNALHHTIMGCYGIGVERLVACLIEENHDDNGPIWPMAVAPWQIHICVLSNKSQAVEDYGRELYETLNKTYEVVLDDRNLAAGVKFADADLLGIPLRLVVSNRAYEQGEVEVSLRDKSMTKKVKMDEVVEEVGRIVSQLMGVN